MADLTNLIQPPSADSLAPTGVTQVDPSLTPNVATQTQTQHVDGKHHGIAGLARDVLGTLGDFLLTRLHMPAMYAPAQHQRELEEAAQNFQTDPLGAIQKVGHVDFGAGQKMYDTYIDNQRQQALASSTIESRNARLSAAQDALAAKTRNTAGAYLGSLDRETDPAKKAALYASLRPQLLALGAKNKVDFSDELPETYNPDVVDAFMNGGVPLGRQRSQTITQDRNDNTNDRAIDRNNTTNRGIDVRAATAAAGQAVTTNGQNLSHNDRVRGQDLTAAGRAANTAATIAHHNATDGARANQLKDGDIRVINGVQYVWNARTRQAEPVTTAK